MSTSPARGFSLIELLVSLAISSFIIAGVIQIFATSSTNFQSSEGLSRIQEHTRFLFNQLETDIYQAGSGPCFSINSASEQDRIRSVLGFKAGNFEKYDMRYAISGSEASGANNSDELFIRFAAKSTRVPVLSISEPNKTITLDTTSPNYAALEQFQVVFAGNCSRVASFLITNSPGNDGEIKYEKSKTATDGVNKGQFNLDEELTIGNTFVNADPNKSIADISLSYVYAGESVVQYSIDNSMNGTCSNANPQFCTLYRNGEEVIEGVETFEIEYGWQNSADNKLTYGDWDQVEAANQVDNIDRIKATITINSINTANTVSGDKLLKKSFSRVFMVRNQLPID